MYTKTVREPNKNKRIFPSETAFIGAIITLIGGFFISYNYIESQKIMAYDYMANAFYDGNQVTVAENENNQTEEKKEGLSGEITNDYIGYLNIYNLSKDKPYTIRGTLKLISPYVSLICLAWILLVVGWYIIGLPVGPNVYPTL